MPRLLLLLVCVRPLLAAALCFCSTGASTGVRIKANPGVAPSVWTSCVLLRQACCRGLLGPGPEALTGLGFSHMGQDKNVIN